MKYKGFILVASLVVLSACRTTVKTVENDLDELVAEDFGYVLIGLDTNKDLFRITLNGPSDYSLSSANLDHSTNYILTKVKAGSYEVSRLYTTKHTSFSFDDELNFKFSVKPNTISYVGHFEIVTRGYFGFASFLQLDNRSSEAYVYMSENFPNILEKRAIRYGGPGEDDFLEYVISEVAP
uniref:hypothetical protein n=1 Tax=Ningiella ruwaisensis TaxID=2364274 RepID=UPI0010A05B03|nr:hypothetical protein [Ningiella ruwaisensis]